MLYVVTARETTDGERRAFRRKGWTRSPMVTTSLRVPKSLLDWIQGARHQAAHPVPVRRSGSGLNNAATPRRRQWRWNGGARQPSATARSWFQKRPDVSLEMFDKSAVTATDSVIDIGGGAAALVDELLARRFEDLTVLDISPVGLGHSQSRLGADAARVTWLVADILEWEPQRSYRVWHDRAVFHFLTAEADQLRYLHTLDQATIPGSTAIFGCFAADGPQYCSGLPVARYEPVDLAERLGPRWQLIAHTHEKHTTPSNATQSFSWSALQRIA